jgi:CRISPR-associated RAMP protein (TIGR02581 family)
MASCSEYLKSKLVEEKVADFAEFKVEYILNLNIVNTTPLYVGSGRGGDVLGATTDLSVIRGKVAIVGEDGSVRIYEGPIIPGSSLKGIMRSNVESLAASLGYLSVTVTPPKGGEQSEQTIMRCTGEDLSSIESWLSKSDCDKNDDAREFVDRIFESCLASPVVRLFGAPWLASHVYVYDGYPVSLEPPPTRTVTRVAIDRLTGSQKPGQLYTMELVEAGVTWNVKIVVKNIDLTSDSREAVLFRELLKLMALEGLAVGGRTSIGHGLLKLLPEKSRVTKVFMAEGELRRETISLNTLIKG